jgi:hypothetical protein
LVQRNCTMWRTPTAVRSRAQLARGAHAQAPTNLVFKVVRPRWDVPSIRSRYPPHGDCGRPVPNDPLSAEVRPASAVYPPSPKCVGGAQRCRFGSQRRSVIGRNNSSRRGHAGARAGQESTGWLARLVHSKTPCRGRGTASSWDRIRGGASGTIKGGARHRQWPVPEIEVGRSCRRHARRANPVDRAPAAERVDFVDQNAAVRPLEAGPAEHGKDALC